jgi:hypothetical protein
MSTTEVKELVDKGITALKSGDREEARFWLAAAIQHDAHNERAWVYLAAVLPRQQAIAALERVLVLNPQNAKAQKGLNILLNQPAHQTTTTTVQEPARPVRTMPRPSIIARSDRRNSRRQDRTTQPDELPTEIKTSRVPDFAEKPAPFIPPATPFTPPIVIHLGPSVAGGGVDTGAENTVFDRGFHTLDTDRESAEKDIHPETEPIEEGPALEPPIYDEPYEFADRVRKILNMPAPPVIRQPRRLSPLSTFLLVVLPVVVVAAFIFFVFLNPGPTKNNLTAVALDTNLIPATISNLSNTNTYTVPAQLSPAGVSPVTSPEAEFTSTPAVPTAAPTITSQPIPTVQPVIKVDVAQGERAALRGLAVTFSNYENRSNNFSFAGAGTPKNGFHFEGVTVSLENTGDKLVPVQVDAFQGVDGRNNYLKPRGGGRVPSMDISRLQMGEQRSAWLTFEVEDGTTLRRVTFSPTSEPDLNNSASVNLTLPAVTPAPVVKPTPVPTTTPRPTATPLPTATPAPTGTPQRTATVVVAGGANQPVNVPLTTDPTEIVVSPSPQPTAAPTMTPLPTATPEPTPTPLPTRLPAQVGQMNQRLVIGNYALTVTNFQGGPSIKPPPLIMPPGYHYETVKITVENVGDSDVSDFLGSYPFFLRDGDDRIFSVGPESLDANATDRFNPQTFAPTVIGAGKKSVTGVLYFLVKDMAPPGRTFIFYANNSLDSPRIEVPLK